MCITFSCLNVSPQRHQNQLLLFHYEVEIFQSRCAKFCHENYINKARSCWINSFTMLFSDNIYGCNIETYTETKKGIYQLWIRQKHPVFQTLLPYHHFQFIKSHIAVSAVILWHLSKVFMNDLKEILRYFPYH